MSQNLKVLIAEDQKEVRELLTFIVENEFNATIYEAKSGAEAISFLEKNTRLDLIISDRNMPGGNGGEIYNFLREKNLKIPFILCTSGDLEEFPEFSGAELAGFVKKPDVTAELIRIIKTISEQRFREYYKVRVSTLIKLNMLNTDLYIKLSDAKYVKVLRQGDSFSEADMSRYTARQIDYLHIRKEDNANFLSRLSRELTSISEIKELDIESSLKISTETHEIMHEAINAFGLSEEVQALIKVSISFALRLIQKDPEISSIFSKLSVDSESYISSHSIQLVHLSCAIAFSMGWTSEVTFYKLALASMLHDITLNDPKIARAQTLCDLNRLKDLEFTEDQIEEFKHHPFDSAALVTKMSGLPSDVDTIIQQHHESPDGRGFPKRLTYSDIHPLSSAFIVAHHLLNFMLENRTGNAVVDFLNEAASSYRHGHFRKIIHAMTKAVVEAEE